MKNLLDMQKKKNVENKQKIHCNNFDHNIT